MTSSDSDEERAERQFVSWNTLLKDFPVSAGRRRRRRNFRWQDLVNSFLAMNSQGLLPALLCPCDSLFLHADESFGERGSKNLGVFVIDIRNHQKRHQILREREYSSFSYIRREIIPTRHQLKTKEIYCEPTYDIPQNPSQGFVAIYPSAPSKKRIRPTHSTYRVEGKG